jgi:branched-chain amino acid aminotransferase
MKDWTAYWNGRFVPAGEVCISPSDRGFILGDAAYEVTRTYRHRPFHLDWHLDRLYESLAYMLLDPVLTRNQMQAITEEVLGRNLPRVPVGGDVSIAQRVTRGPHAGPFAGIPPGPPTVLITCRPVHFRPFARLYTEGVELQIAPFRAPARGGVDPRMKTHSRLLLAMGAVAVAVPERTVLPLFADIDGYITESASANVFFVVGRELVTPPDAAVLGGITRRVVIDLARALGITVVVRPVAQTEVLTMDEAFLTATSFAVLPVKQIGDHMFAPVPGAVTTRLTQAFSEQVGVDIVEQARVQA